MAKNLITDVKKKRFNSSSEYTGRRQIHFLMEKRSIKNKLKNADPVEKNPKIG